MNPDSHTPTGDALGRVLSGGITTSAGSAKRASPQAKLDSFAKLASWPSTQPQIPPLSNASCLARRLADSPHAVAPRKSHQTAHDDAVPSVSEAKAPRLPRDCGTTYNANSSRCDESKRRKLENGISALGGGTPSASVDAEARRYAAEPAFASISSNKNDTRTSSAGPTLKLGGSPRGPPLSAGSPTTSSSKSNEHSRLSRSSRSTVTLMNRRPSQSPRHPSPDPKMPSRSTLLMTRVKSHRPSPRRPSPDPKMPSRSTILMTRVKNHRPSPRLTSSSSSSTTAPTSFADLSLRILTRRSALSKTSCFR